MALSLRAGPAQRMRVRLAGYVEDECIVPNAKRAGIMTVEHLQRHLHFRLESPTPDEAFVNLLFFIVRWEWVPPQSPILYF
jgi:hypothetical protein